MPSHSSPPNPTPLLDSLPEPLTPPESDSVRAALDALRRRHDELTTLYAASARLSATMEWSHLLEETLATVVQLARADSASLMLMDERTDSLYIARAHNLPDAVVAHTRVQLGEGMAGWVAQQRQPLLLIGDLASAQYPKAFPKPKQIASSICAPLIVSTADAPHLLGVVNVSRRHGAPMLTQDDLHLLSAFCQHTANVLHTARLHSRAERRVAQLQHLIEISQHLISTLDIDTVLRAIIDRAIELLHCQAGSLLLVDEQTGELVFKVATGPASEKLINTRLPAGAGIAGAVAKEGIPLIVNDAKADPRHYDKIDYSTALTTRSLLCVPLFSQGRVIGVVEVMNKTDGTLLDEEDRDVLTAFAIQSVIAMENARLYSELKRSFTDTVRVITNAVEARDPYTAGHTERVTRIALEMARELGWSREQLEILEIGALLHDIGKIGISDLVLRKPNELTEDEYSQMQQHPIVGAQMLEGVSILRPMLPYILFHQERFDGAGYPFGLTGTEIPLEGRLLAVADSFDAMTSTRPYRERISVDDAIEEIISSRGTQFDPMVVDALLRVHAKGRLVPLLEGHAPEEQHR